MSRPTRRGSPLSRPCRSCRCSSPSTSMMSYSKHARYPRIFTTTNFVYWPYIQYPVYWYDLCMPHPTGRKTKSTESSVSIIPVSSPSINTLSGSKRARYPSIYYKYYNLPVICDTQYTGGTHPVPSVRVRSVHVSPRKKEQSIEASVSIMSVSSPSIKTLSYTSSNPRSTWTGHEKSRQKNGQQGEKQGEKGRVRPTVVSSLLDGR